MTQNEECQELLMQDVVRIDFMPTTALKIAVPFNVPNIAEAVVTMSDDSALTDAKLYGASLLSLSVSDYDQSDAGLQEGTSHRVTENTEMAGVVKTHTLQAHLEYGFQAVREEEKALQESDFHIVLTTFNGTRYLAYSLPNTSQFSIDDQMGEPVQMSVKAVVQSMSGFIKIQA